MPKILDLILHLDKYINEIIQQHGTATYLILFAVIFCETGLVVTPFLPGDSLLFAVGIFCHPEKSQLNVFAMFFVLCTAALMGDSVNYFIGKTSGHKLFKNENSKVFKKSHLAKTHEFFEKHGRNTIILARFVPIVRTFCPFVAGMGQMPYSKFITYSIAGAVLWVGLFLFAGYFIGQIPAVHDNFSVAILVMVVVTGAPLVFEVYRNWKESKKEKAS